MLRTSRLTTGTCRRPTTALLQSCLLLAGLHPLLVPCTPATVSYLQSHLTSNTTALGSSSYRCSTADTSSGVAAAAAPRRPRVMLPPVASDLQEMAEWLGTRPAATGQRGARWAAAPGVRRIHRFSAMPRSLSNSCTDHQALPGRGNPGAAACWAGIYSSGGGAPIESPM